MTVKWILLLTFWRNESGKLLKNPLRLTFPKSFNTIRYNLSISLSKLSSPLTWRIMVFPCREAFSCTTHYLCRLHSPSTSTWWCYLCFELSKEHIDFWRHNLNHPVSSSINSSTNLLIMNPPLRRSLAFTHIFSVFPQVILPRILSRMCIKSANETSQPNCSHFFLKMCQIFTPK